MSTIGVVTTCHTYVQYIGPWLESIRALTRTPDKVVIAATDVELVRDYVGDHWWAHDVLVVQGPRPFRWGSALDAAIEACETDWITWIGIDDVYKPWALDGWEDSHADIIAFGLEAPAIKYARTYSGIPQRTELLDTERRNGITAGSPIRRSLWEQLKFDSETWGPLEDWAFTVRAAQLGATVDITGRVDFEYAVHDGQNRFDEESFAKRLEQWKREQRSNS